MLVRDCMTTSVELGKPDMSLFEAAQKMRDGDFGALPIQEDDRLIGMITDRDIAIRGVAEGQDPKQTQVRSIMSGKVLYCFEDQSLEEVSRNLGDNKIRRLPVLNRNKRLTGILALGDLSHSDAAPERVEEALSRISEPSNSRSQSW